MMIYLKKYGGILEMMMSACGCGKAVFQKFKTGGETVHATLLSSLAHCPPTLRHWEDQLVRNK